MNGSLRERIVGRTSITNHDGESGAVLERARLDDGDDVILKTFDPASDITMLVTGRTVPLEVELWQAGVFDDLPDELSHVISDAWQEDGAWVVAMRDLGDRLIGFKRRVSREDCRRLFAAAVALHDSWAGQPPANVWPVEQRITMFSRQVIGQFAGGENPLPDWVLAGWDAFDATVPKHISTTVHAIHADPQMLTLPLQSFGGRTLLHGDYWTPNLAIEGDRVTAIDWALATAGPPLVEFASFLVGCADQVDATRDELVDDLRAAWHGRNEERHIRLGLILGVVEMGWNLAWHHQEHPTPTTQAALDWWLERAEDALSMGLVGVSTGRRSR